MARPWVVRPLLALVLVAGVLAASPSTGVGADLCNSPVVYPGDDASPEAIAQWMAHGARSRGIPGELPVMAALVESGMRNVHGGDTDAVGYFGMRVSIWDAGAYAGFPDDPGLQLTWFIDQAIAVRDRHIAAGDVGFGTDPSTWGDWIADVEQPAEEFRGRYQLELGEASQLVGASCSDLAAPVAIDDSYSALQNWPLSVIAPGVLANDSSSAAGTTAQLVAGPTHGSLLLAADGSFVYQGAEDFVGTDSFTYRALAGAQQSASATVTLSVTAACDGQRATIVGTPGSNHLNGTPGADVIVGLAGDDVLVGGGGNDRLCGGSGQDTLSGGSGDDTLRGGSGFDRCIGVPGTDDAAGCELSR
jgi:hypothetical protein